MNLKISSVCSVLVLLLGAVSQSAFAAESIPEDSLLKKDLKSIMNDYKLAVQKARADLLKAVQKANADAKDAVQKGIPIDQINADSKAYIEKAKIDFKLAINKAKAEAKSYLLQIKSAVDQKNSS
jgi:hypothetical protein